MVAGWRRFHSVSLQPEPKTHCYLDLCCNTFRSFNSVSSPFPGSCGCKVIMSNCIVKEKLPFAI